MSDYKSRLEKLTSTQLALLKQRLDQLLSSHSKSSCGKKRLISFIKVENQDYNVKDLKLALEEKLPNYMVPDSIIKLDEFKYLPNGKIDIKRLPKQKHSKNEDNTIKTKNNKVEDLLTSVWEEILHVKPIHSDDNFFELGGDSILSIQIISRLRKEGLIIKANTLFNHQTIKELAPFVKVEKSDTENIQDLLIAIWEEVLHIKPVNIDDNFFELGGDSILSIQIISRLRKKGYHLKANTLFNHQTIKELALFVKKEEKETVSEEPDGELILTPIQHWFFENHKNAPHFWNQIFEVDIPQSFSDADLEHIILKLIETHDGLRLGFIKNNAIWESKILSHTPDKILVYKDFSDVEEEHQEDVIEDFIYEQQDNYSLVNNYLFRGVLMNLQNDTPKKLYLIAHHLIVDQISKIVLEKDFTELYEQSLKNTSLHLANPSSTYRNYITKLNQLKTDINTKESLDYWKSQLDISQKLPLDFEFNLPILESDVETAKIGIDETLTESLQNITKNKSNLTVEEILIASLTKTICEWSNAPEFVMLKESLGRQIEDHHSDFSETVGWLTSINPLKVGYKDNLDLKSFILGIKDTVRNIPNKGLDFGVLRYLVEDDSIKNSLSYSPPIVFNYLGKMTKSGGISMLEFRTKGANFRSNLSEKDYFFEINTFIKNNTLEVNWSYSNKCHTSETITNLLNSFCANLEEIVNFCSNHDGNIYSASDFPDSDLDNDDLNELLSQL